MLLAIDVGNTNTVFAVYRDDVILAEWRMSTDARRTADEYAAMLFQLFNHGGFSVKDITGAVASFVVPAAVFAVRKLCKDYFGVEPVIIGDPDVKTGVKILLDQPSEAGSDLIVNNVAAWSRHKKPLIIIDFGTATTFQVIGGEGELVGGVIAPGINLSIEALHMAAAQLPTVEVADPGAVIGKGTVSAIQSGIYYGYVGLIEGIVSRIRKEYGKDMVVIATGGLAPLFEKATDVIDLVEHDLVIHGLHLIYKMNR